MTVFESLREGAGIAVAPVPIPPDTDMPSGGEGRPHLIASSDPLDFFGAIRGLVEQSISKEEMTKYSTSSGSTSLRRRLANHVDFSSSTTTAVEDNPSVVEQQLRLENESLRRRVSELERELRQNENNSTNQVCVRACEREVARQGEKIFSIPRVLLWERSLAILKYFCVYLLFSGC